MFHLLKINKIILKKKRKNNIIFPNKEKISEKSIMVLHFYKSL